MKKLLSKLTIYFLILAGLQIGLYFVFPQYIKAPEEVLSLRKALSEKTNIIYFGDSTLITTSAGDTDKRSIDTMLFSIMPQYSIQPIIHSSYHQDLFAKFSSIIARKNKNKFVIIPINMRSFAAAWDQNSSYQFREHVLYLENYYNPFVYPFLPFLVNFHYFNLYPEVPSNPDVYLCKPGYENILKEANNPANKNDFDTRMKGFLIDDYLYIFPENHRKLTSILSSADSFKNSDVTPIFYFTPIDFKTGEKYLGKEFTECLKKNTDLVVSKLKEKNVIVLDLSVSQDSKDFSWQNIGFINEHLSESGRMFVAQSLKNAIMSYSNEHN